MTSQLAIAYMRRRTNLCFIYEKLIMSEQQDVERLVNVSSSSLVRFRELVLDPLKNVISGCLHWVVEQIRECRNDSQTSDSRTPSTNSEIC